MSDDFDMGWMESLDDNFQLGGKVENLTDGEYEFEVRKCEFKNIAKKSMAIVSMDIEVISAGKHMGQVVQHGLYIKDADGAARVGKELAILGFDCSEWTRANGRPFSGEIKKVPKVLKGLRFKAKKTTNSSDDKEFYNLYINKRLPDGKPARLGKDQLDAVDPLGDDPFGG